MKDLLQWGITLLCATFAMGLKITTRGTRVVASQGKDVTLNCDIEGNDFQAFNNPIVCYKRDGDMDVQINTQTAVNKPFSSTKRYTVDMLFESATLIKAILHLKDIKLSHNGTYICKLLYRDTVIDTLSHELIVPVPVEDFQFYTFDPDRERISKSSSTTFQFVENKPAHVNCSCNGGNPQPDLRIYMDNIDITHAFHRTHKAIRSGVPGLGVYYFVTSLSNTSYMASHESRGKTLACAAQVTGEVVVMEKTYTVEVKYAPKFDCPAFHVVLPSDESMTITCGIHANPAVELSNITWYLLGSEVNLTHGESTDNITLSSKIHGETGAILLSLTIKGISNATYQKHIISARNEVGTTEHKLEIRREAPSTPSPPVTTHTGRSDGLVSEASVHLSTSLYIIILIIMLCICKLS